jgi:hypothetical protein
MLPTCVALVPYGNGNPAPDDLLRVSAALGVQVVRDLNPVWGVAAVVSPFLSLEQVPPGYLPLVILDTGAELPFAFHGLHFTEDGRPFALVAHSSSWSLMASHELLEMLVDPYGVRVGSAPSLRDDQGDVEYLVEVCDPCQRATYTIDGVLVSDFVTPAYYDPSSTQGARYSYTGRVEHPRHLLEGGYVSWRVRSWPVDEIWQAVAEKGSRHPRIQQLEDRAPQFSRQWIDSHHAASIPAPPQKLSARSAPLKGARQEYRLGAKSATDYGAILRAEIANMLALDPPRVIDLLKYLTKTDGYRAFKKNPAATLKRFGIVVPAGFDKVKVRDRADYLRVLKAVQSGGAFGLPALDQPGLGAWMCSLGGF